MLNVHAQPQDATVLPISALAMESATPETERTSGVARRIGITSVFGNPADPKCWSGAPYAVGRGLADHGYNAEPISARVRRAQKLSAAAMHVLSGYGVPWTGEILYRGPYSRQKLAREVSKHLKLRHLQRVLHTGSFDVAPMPLPDDADTRHYLYCDHTWNLSLRHRVDASRFGTRARVRFDDLEREAYRQMAHIFVFGRYVRDDLIEHYRVDPNRVTVVGSGHGQIRPYDGPKDYDPPILLFVAKHYFVEKGGPLLLEAFRIARSRRADLRLIVVGQSGYRGFEASEPGIEFRSFVPWPELERLFRLSALLAQPMLNDPWGQVYLEALVSRTPVLGLNRNGLPEIADGGRCGFLVDEATPEALAHAILEAVSDPDRLAAMGTAGQQHVMTNFSWERVTQAIARVMDAEHG